MNKQSFDYLVTNLIAIVNHTFAMQCGEFATALASDQPEAPQIPAFDSKTHLNEFDLDEVLKSGYGDIPEVSDILDQKRENSDASLIDSYLKNLPDYLPNLCQTLSADQLKQWIEFALGVEKNSPLYELHSHLMGDADGDQNNISDPLREAIAFNELEPLNGIDQVPSDAITLDDLTMAATIQSFKVLDWMLKHADLSEDEKLALLVGQMDYPESFEFIFPLLAINSNSRVQLLSAAEQYPAIIDFLNNV